DLRGPVTRRDSRPTETRGPPWQPHDPHRRRQSEDLAGTGRRGLRPDRLRGRRYRQDHHRGPEHGDGDPERALARRGRPRPRLACGRVDAGAGEERTVHSPDRRSPVTARVSILDGNTFVVSDNRGDIEGAPGDDAGLFHMDMRCLSRWILTIDGKRPNVLSIDDFKYYGTQFFSTLSSGTVYVDSHLSCRRQRTVDNGFHEEITIMNHDQNPMEFEVRLDVAADFADLFEVKDKLPKKGELYHRVEGNRLILGYR